MKNRNTIIIIGVILLAVAILPYLSSGGLSVYGESQGSLLPWTKVELTQTTTTQGDILGIKGSTTEWFQSYEGVYAATVDGKPIPLGINSNALELSDGRCGASMREISPPINDYSFSPLYGAYLVHNKQYERSEAGLTTNCAKEITLKLNTSDYPGPREIEIYEWQYDVSQLSGKDMTKLLNDEWNYNKPAQPVTRDGVQSMEYNPIVYANVFIEAEPCPYSFFALAAFDSGKVVTLDGLPNFEETLGFCDALPAVWRDANTVNSYPDYDVYHRLLKGEAVTVGVGKNLVLQWPVDSAILQAECSESGAHVLGITADGVKYCTNIAGQVILCQGYLSDDGTCIEITKENCADGAVWSDELEKCVRDECKEEFGSSVGFLSSYKECGVIVPPSEVCPVGFTWIHETKKCEKYVGSAVYTLEDNANTYNFYELPLKCTAKGIKIEKIGATELFTCNENPSYTCSAGRFYYTSDLACVLGAPSCDEDEVDAGNGLCEPVNTIIVDYDGGRVAGAFKTVTRVLTEYRLFGWAVGLIIGLFGLLLTVLGLVFFKTRRR